MVVPASGMIGMTCSKSAVLIVSAVWSAISVIKVKLDWLSTVTKNFWPDLIITSELNLAPNASTGEA